MTNETSQIYCCLCCPFLCLEAQDSFFKIRPICLSNPYIMGGSIPFMVHPPYSTASHTYIIDSYVMNRCKNAEECFRSEPYYGYPYPIYFTFLVSL